MIALHFVGDGERDGQTVPHLVRRILASHHQRDVHFAPSLAAWARLSRKGYARKLRFAQLQAEDRRCAGLVATVDRDKTPAKSRLKILKDARNESRAAGQTIPIALGEANPHGEAWLTADPTAVRDALGLSSEMVLSTGLSPKDELTRLWRERASAVRHFSATDALAEISKRVDVKVVATVSDSGFDEFADEVCEEIGPLV